MCARLPGVLGLATLLVACPAPLEVRDDSRHPAPLLAEAHASEDAGPGVDAAVDAGTGLDTAPLTDTIRCTGNDDRYLESESIRTEGDALIIGGNCSFTLVDSVVLAQGRAIVVQGNATVIVEGGEISGLVLVQGRGTLKSKGARYNTALSLEGSGRYQDLGGNQWPD